MPKDFRATTLERSIGRTLATWRNESELTLTEAGERVGFSSAKLSMMENAVQPSAALDVMALGYVYKVPAPEWQFVVSQTERALELRVLRQPGPKLFDPAEDFPHLVGAATLARTFTTDVVPTAFQLVGYTLAVTQSADPVRAAHAARAQKAWATRSGPDDPLAVEAVFPEALLQLVVGGRRVMKAQLLHLMEMSERPEVSIRVVPRSAGAYPAMGCPFTWLRFPHRQHDDVVYIDSLVHGEYVEEQAQVEKVEKRFTALQNLALGEGESMELIAEAAASLS